MNWEPVIRHRSLIEVECRRWCYGSDVLHEELINHASDMIARYWPARADWTEHSTARRLCRWACLYVLRRRAAVRAGADVLPLDVERNAVPAPEVPELTPGLVAVCDAIEGMSERDKLVFRAHYDWGETWTDAMRQAGYQATRAPKTHRTRWLERVRRAVIAGLCASAVVTANAIEPPPGPPPYLSNARVAALWAWAQAAQAEIERQEARIQELEAQPDPEAPAQPIQFPSSVKMTFELQEWGSASVYVVRFADARYDGQAPDPIPQPLTLDAKAFVAWGAEDGSEWKTFGGPRPSGDVALGWFAPGNWVEYQIPAGKWSRVVLKWGSPKSGAQTTVSVNGADVATLDVPNTGAWGTVQTVSFDTTITGPATLRVSGSRGSTPGWWVGDFYGLELQP